ncbi:type II toxin-antitoxin system HicA family toxin [Candidatus Magnetobacterium casense]|uniref:Type II toxin-antitoxin system HicA family toxin n=1 Tax=Candidatus Magnetobacterium casense TaxID=1455061 RepID=A0ABS6S008_9BACT|nr:type II toxin-antitoxin system HicA family toxin [Candidatus Magnetobacterium casensis]MBV6342192.1 type II toxin-antitoxin system HicA family toxin [Candidatus Magnetobacterium casensis]
MSSKFPAITSDEVIRVLKKVGFRHKRQSGTSHAIFYRDVDNKRINVPVHSGQIIKRKTLKSILSSAELSLDDFNRLRGDN